MIIEINVNPKESTRSEFAPVNISCGSASLSSSIDIDFSTLLDKCAEPTNLAVDFLFVSAVIYCIDKLIPRSISIDNWTRQLQVEIPVSDPDLWNQNAENFNSAISFLTGDFWNISYRDLECNLVRPKKVRYRLFPLETPDAVSLFSGGLDSLIGAIDWLESNPEGTIKLVSHYDPDVAGPKSDQKRLIGELKEYYGNRISYVQVRVGQTPSGGEATFRSRSIIFIGLGIYVASSVGENISLIMPENGNIALNVPLTPSRRGACSSRTAHPFFLNSIGKEIQDLGFQNRIINPFELKTKGECVEQCFNQSVLRNLASISVSCAKRGRHKIHSINRSARQCGRCMPCIYRRAALHKIGLDTEDYGRDICKGEVDLESNQKLVDDFRAYVSFISRNPSRDEISSLLLANGNLDISLLPHYGDLVFRALEEIRALLRDKATGRVLRQTGI